MMEHSSFLDFICQNVVRVGRDNYLMMSISEYAKLMVAYNLGIITTEQMADGCVALIRSVRSREVGQLLYESYMETIQ